MKERLVTSRTVVRALRRVPPCPSLAAITAEWDGEPSPLWRKRLARHVRDCPWCLSDIGEMVPAERLLGGLPLLPVPAALAGGALAGLARRVPGRWLAHRPGVGATRHARHARLLPKGAAALQPKLVAASLAVVTCAAGRERSRPSTCTTRRPPRR